MFSVYLNNLDDWFILAQSEVEPLSHRTLLLSHLEHWGIRVNLAESALSHSQRVSFLGTVLDYGSLLGAFPPGTVPGTWHFFSTTSAEVPGDPYSYQNVTWKLYRSLIGRRKSSLLRHWTCDTSPNIYPLDLNQHSQRRIGRNFCLNKCTFLYQPKNVCFVVCWGSTDVPLVDSRGADPVRAWWGDVEWKSLMYILFVLCIFLEYVFCLYFYLCMCVLLQLKTIWSNKCPDYITYV